MVKYFPELLVCDGSASTVPQDEVVPLVVKYLPELPVWLGTTYAVESVATKVLDDGIVVPLMLVAVATPKTGVTNVGVLANTNAPVPVSSEMTPASSAEVVAANTDNLSAVLVKVADVGIVVELIVNPVMFVYVVPEAIVVLPRVGAL